MHIQSDKINLTTSVKIAIVDTHDGLLSFWFLFWLIKTYEGRLSFFVKGDNATQNIFSESFFSGFKHNLSS
jgi:hypothetical protein